MTCKEMFEFRISKYNKERQGNQALIKNEWTSVSDIGKRYNGKEFTYIEYEQVESAYLLLIKKICSELNVSQMKITDLEDYFNMCPYNNGSILSNIDDIVKVSKDCLREKYWCKLNADRLLFHFGYDYYLYVCSSLDDQYMRNLVHKIGLFLEKKPSPYK